MNIDLKARKALVCGASQGIGEALARSLAGQGAEIILIARNETKLEKVKESLPGNGHLVKVADLGEESDIQDLLTFLSSHPADIVVNNTGGPSPGQINEASTEQFQKGIQMHLFASQQIMQAVLPHMKEHGYGRFINIISTSVKIPIPGLGVSNTIRGAMASWAKTLSLEVGSYGITVNNILPGFINTDRLHGLISSIAERDNQSIETVAEGMKKTIPAGRFGEASEIGDLAAFLASPAASYINGTSIPVDGGRTGTI